MISSGRGGPPGSPTLGHSSQEIFSNTCQIIQSIFEGSSDRDIHVEVFLRIFLNVLAVKALSPVADWFNFISQNPNGLLDSFVKIVSTLQHSVRDRLQFYELRFIIGQRSLQADYSRTMTKERTDFSNPLIFVARPLVRPIVRFLYSLSHLCDPGLMLGRIFGQHFCQFCIFCFDSRVMVLKSSHG